MVVAQFFGQVFNGFCAREQTGVDAVVEKGFQFVLAFVAQVVCDVAKLERLLGSLSLRSGRTW